MKKPNPGEASEDYSKYLHSNHEVQKLCNNLENG